MKHSIGSVFFTERTIKLAMATGNDHYTSYIVKITTVIVNTHMTFVSFRHVDNKPPLAIVVICSVSHLLITRHTPVN